MANPPDRRQPPSSSAGSPPRQTTAGGGWPAFEQRVRSRRAERCAANVRAATARGDLVAAREALDELGEIMPAHPELPALRLLVTSPPRSAESMVASPVTPAESSPSTPELKPAAPVPPPVQARPTHTATSPRAADATRGRHLLHRSRVLRARPPLAEATLDKPLRHGAPPPTRPRRPAAVLTAAAVVVIGVLLTSPASNPPSPELRGAGDQSGSAEPLTGHHPLNFGTLPALTARVDLVVASGPEVMAAAPVASPPTPVATAARSMPPPTPSAAPADQAALRTEPVRHDSLAAAPPPPPDALASLSDANMPVAAVTPTVLPETPQPAAIRPPDHAPEQRVAATTGAAVVDTPPTGLAVPNAESAVRDVLQRYVTAYNRLDASAAGAVWPAVDRPALERAFAQLDSQTLRFDRCDIAVEDDGGTATCAGQARWVPRVGGRDPKRESRTWRFELARDGDSWIITRAEARR